MEPLIIYKGTDEQFIIHLFSDEDQTESINIDNLNDLEIILTIGGYIIGQWNKSGSGDYEALTRIDPYNYYFWLKTNDNTKIGIVDFWLHAKKNLVELPDSIQDTIRSSLAIAQVTETPF